MIKNIFFAAILGGLIGSIVLFIVNYVRGGNGVAPVSPEEKKQKMLPGIVAAVAWLSMLLMPGKIIEFVAEMLLDIGGFFDMLGWGAISGGGSVYLLAVMTCGLAILAASALMTVTAWLLPRLEFNLSKILIGVTGVFSVLAAISIFWVMIATKVEVEEIRSILYVLLLLATGSVAVILVIRPAIFHTVERQLQLLYIIPAFVYLCLLIINTIPVIVGLFSFPFNYVLSFNYVFGILTGVSILVAILVLAIKNNPEVKWLGLTHVILVAITGLFSLQPFFDAFNILFLMLATITVIDIVKWWKAGNTLQWSPPELYKNPVLLVILAVVIIEVVSFIS
jgi:hypothetical protein